MRGTWERARGGLGCQWEGERGGGIEPDEGGGTAKGQVGPVVGVPCGTPPPPKGHGICTHSEAHHFKEEREGGPMQMGVRNCALQEGTGLLFSCAAGGRHVWTVGVCGKGG